jgi:hypothetical protein
MWGRDRKRNQPVEREEPQPKRLTEALRQARIETAERSSVVVDLRDAELARLELLNDAIAPLFAEIPPEVELFDRGISRGDPPRLWIDVISHVAMGRDKRLYRFVQDTRFGRKVLAESTEVAVIADAITNYVARRLLERERALADDSAPVLRGPRVDAILYRKQDRGRAIRMLILGMIIGSALLFGVLMFLASRTALSP